MNKVCFALYPPLQVTPFRSRIFTRNNYARLKQNLFKIFRQRAQKKTRGKLLLYNNPVHALHDQISIFSMECMSTNAIMYNQKLIVHNCISTHALHQISIFLMECMCQTKNRKFYFSVLQKFFTVLPKCICIFVFCILCTDGFVYLYLFTCALRFMHESFLCL